MNPDPQPSSINEIKSHSRPSGNLNESLFTPDEEGNLAIGDIDRDIRFGFTVDRTPYAAKIGKQEGKYRITLCGDLGYVPFSAQNNFARASILKVVRMAKRLTYSRFEIRKDQRLLLFGEAELSPALTQGEIFAAICKILMEGRPYLTLIAECMAFAIPPKGFNTPRKTARVAPEDEVAPQDTQEPEEREEPPAEEAKSEDGEPAAKKPQKTVKTAKSKAAPKRKAKPTENKSVKKPAGKKPAGKKPVGKKPAEKKKKAAAKKPKTDG